MIATPGHTQSSETQSNQTHRWDIAIPAGSLGFGLQLLARQTGISVGGTEPGIAAIRIEAVRGTMTAAEALQRLLRDTPYIAISTGPNSYRIAQRRIAPAPPDTHFPARPALAAPPPQASAVPIIVTASKRAVPFPDYPGGVTVFDFTGALPSREMAGLETLLSAAPVTGSTALGPGRNKIFIRGVSDSSFNGPTQATVGLYFGEQRLIYSAPNPELRMYDIDRVELLEGPQGTLYGAGALGGIVRIMPRRPELGEWSAQVWSGASQTRHGAPGYDLAGRVNAPIGDHVAIRGVAYIGRLGGYIDDGGRDLEDVNRTDISGGRIGVRADLGDDWILDVEALHQELETRDGQYAETVFPPLTRASTIAQPFDSDVSSAGITIQKDWGDLSLVSVTGLVHSSLDTRFDASALSPTNNDLAFDEFRDLNLISHETRLLGGEGSHSWVAGLGVVSNVDRRSQFIGDPADPARFADTRNVITEIALFGEASLPITDALTATAGLRLVYAITHAEQSLAGEDDIEPRSHLFRALPVVALSLRFDDQMLGYIRYQQGYRSGGLSISGALDSPVVTRFEPDALRTVEIGVRRSADTGLPLELSLTGFFTDWNDIQADLITEQGFPVTRNLGSGRILGLTASTAYRPVEGLKLRASLFANETELTPDPTLGFGEPGPIPNVAEFGGSAGIEYSTEVSAAGRIEARTDVTYVGQSRLGIEPFLDFEQGGQATLSASIAYRHDRFTIALEGENLTDAQGNRFGFGNPFSLADRPQTTPLRPRLFRLSTTLRF